MRAGLVVMALALGTAPALGASRPAEQPKPVSELLRCRAIGDPAARLACFDAAASALSAQIASRDIQLIDREGVRQAQQSLFGFNLPKLPLFASTGDGREAKVLDAVVAHVRTVDYDKLEFSLPDGAVWRTTEALEWTTPRAGSKVHIEQGTLGGYFIRFDGAQAVRGIRVG